MTGHSVQRMGWGFRWVSSLGNDFNWDYHISFTAEQVENKEMYYNYRIGGFPSPECPGISSFYKDENGDVFHTYSSYARGLENFRGPIICSTSFRRDATKPISRTVWPGCVTMIVTTTTHLSIRTGSCGTQRRQLAWRLATSNSTICQSRSNSLLVC